MPWLSKILNFIFETESYVSDELIVSRAGVRVRIGNTDAEGRMVMADVLCKMKEKVRIFLFLFDCLVMNLLCNLLKLI